MCDKKDNVEEYSGEVQINNKYGLHARPAMRMVEVAKQYDCEIRISRGEEIVDGKSLMGLLTLAAEKGVTLGLCARGVNAEKAYLEIKDMIEGRFGEKE